MQTEESEYDFGPGLLETPSLMTPNIDFSRPTAKSVFTTAVANMSIANGTSSTSNSSSILLINNERTLPLTSADLKVSKIQKELQRSLIETRKPTPSPFENITSNNTFNSNKTIVANSNEDTGTIQIPSTADVVIELEALTNANNVQKVLMNDNQECESGLTLNGDNLRYDASPTVNLGTNVSPKKKFLIRSQSHTEPASPIQNNNNNNNNISQSQKANNDNSMIMTQNGLDEENSMDDSINNHFARVADMQMVSHSIDTNIDNHQQFKSVVDAGPDPHITIQLKSEQTIIPHPTIKQQPMVLNHVNNNNNNNNIKRTFHQTNTNNVIPTITKANTIIMTQPINEVTSTDQLPSIKRQRTAPAPMNTTVMNFRSAFPSTIGTAPPNSLSSSTTTNGSNVSAGSEDQRKKQIRDSNREAARRCRERRRQYIEQLEGNLEQYKAQIKQLSDKLARVERDNTQLRAILSETNMIHQGPRMSVKDSHIEYGSVVVTGGMDLNSESNHQMDGRTIQRSYIDRNNL